MSSSTWRDLASHVTAVPCPFSGTFLQSDEWFSFGWGCLILPSQPFLPFFFLFSSFSQRPPSLPRLQWLPWPLSQHPLHSGFRSQNPLTGFFRLLLSLGSQPKASHNKIVLDTQSGLDLYFCKGYKYYLLRSSTNYLTVYTTSTHFNFFIFAWLFFESPPACTFSFPLWLLALGSVLALLAWTVAIICLALSAWLYFPFSNCLIYSDNPVSKHITDEKSYVPLPHSSIKFKLLKNAVQGPMWSHCGLILSTVLKWSCFLAKWYKSKFSSDLPVCPFVFTFFFAWHP